jgi:hypothetical protein
MFCVTGSSPASRMIPVRQRRLGRRPAGYRTMRAPTNIGEYFANMARLEAASVFAFERLHDELEQMNAPQRLIARVRRR